MVDPHELTAGLPVFFSFSALLRGPVTSSRSSPLDALLFCIRDRPSRAGCSDIVYPTWRCSGWVCCAPGYAVRLVIHAGSLRAPKQRASVSTSKHARPVVIRCILDPLINRRARINHANPRFATSRGQAASKGHDHPPRAAPPRAAAAACRSGCRCRLPAAGPAVRRRVRRGRPVRLREPAVRPAAVAGRRRTGTGTASPRTTGPASPRQRAVADAARIMASFPRPPGAVRTGPIASLTQSGARPVTPDLASVTRWWRVPGRPQEVLAWIRAHLPPGFAPAGTGIWVRVVDRHVRAARRAGRADPARAGGAGRPVREPDRDPGGCPGRLAACPSGRRTGPASRREC